MKKACLILVCMFIFVIGWSYAADLTKLTVRSPETGTPVDQVWQGSGSKDIVWDNGVTDWVGIAASQYDNTIILDPVVADDFEFGEDILVADVHWIGGYWNGPPDDGNFDWVIVFYQDSGGLGLAPGDIIDSFYMPNAGVNETFISGTPGGSNFYSYTVDLPDTILFSANTKYWISLQGYGVYPPQSGVAYDTTILLHEAVFYSTYFGFTTWTDGSVVFGNPINLCFQLTGMPAEEPLDWGDAPDSYHTLAASNGALHPIVPGMFLGAAIDGEADGQPSPTALLDDNTGFPDDEDGIVFTNLLVVGSTVNLKVIASMPGFLDAWIDFDANGTWDDPSERIVPSATPVNPGVNNFAVGIPSTAAAGISYGRFRYSSVGGLPPDGPGPDGEVEDYRIFIQEPLENIKWYQPPDLDNTGIDVDMFPLGFPDVDGLADDFLCRESGPITDIHFWASFMEDNVPDLPFQIFEITIYSDIPAGVYAPWSMPGEILWRHYVDPGGYLVRQITDNNPEDYYFPAQQAWFNDDHFNCYQYDFFIPPESAFVQVEGIIYWLGIRDLSYTGEYRFGWKTCELGTRWNDDATYLCDPPAFWCDIHYPQGHEFMDLSLDLAFALSTEAPCDCDPGEANGDGTYNIFDITYLISFLYLGGPPPIPYPLCNCDANCDCTCNIFDITYLIDWLYRTGPAPCTCQQWLAICGPPLRK